MAKKIIWSYTAQNDRKEILLYWFKRNRSMSYPRKLNQLFIQAARIIAKYPNIGRPSGYKNTRIKIVRDYLMIYKEFENYISILTIWDSRQDPLRLEKILQ